MVVIFDQALTRKKQGVFKSTVKPQLKALAKPFHLCSQPMQADANGQIADYVSRAKFVQVERNEHRPWLALQSRLQPTSSNMVASTGSVEFTGKSDRPD